MYSFRRTSAPRLEVPWYFVHALSRHERVRLPFKSDLRSRAVSGNDASGGIQGKQSLPDGRLDGARVASPQVRASDPAAKERIARQKQLLAGNVETERPGRVSRCM